MKTKWTKKRPTEPGHYWCRFARRLPSVPRIPVLPLMAVFFQEEGEKKLRWIFCCGTGLSPKLLEKYLEWWPVPVPIPEEGRNRAVLPECSTCDWKVRALRGEEAIKALADHRAKPSQQWLAAEQKRIDEENKKKAKAKRRKA